MRNICKYINSKRKVLAFTLAEVLITLGIIGVVAEITIPTLMANINDLHYKSAAKLAFSDLYNVYNKAVADKVIVSRTGQFDLAASSVDWTAIKSGFLIQQDCIEADLDLCWKDGDKVNSGYPNTTFSGSFVDNSGRSWAQYFRSESIYLVDTNGFKGPNRFGKDRWIFGAANQQGTVGAAGYNVKIIPFGDSTAVSTWCSTPPCYYSSWIYN